MRRMYDHRCESCGEKSEHYIAEEEKTTVCPHCGGVAHRIVSAAHFDYLHMGVDKDGLPTAGVKWARMHREAAGKGTQSL